METKSTPRPPKWLTTLFLFLSIIAGLKLIGLFFNGIYLFFSENPIPNLSLDGATYTEKSPGVFLAIALMAVFQLLVFFLILQIWKLLKLFTQEELFSESQAQRFRTIGKLVIALGVADPLFEFIRDLVLKSSSHIRLGFATPAQDTFWFSLALGIFLIFLGKIFDRGRILKEENELTI